MSFSDDFNSDDLLSCPKNKKKKSGLTAAKAAANAKRKVQHSWQESEEVKLIKYVRNRRLLYDCNDSQYKNKYLKSNAWEEVANELGIADVDSDEAKNKWNALRNNFKMHLSRFRARKSGQGLDEVDDNLVKWPHFKSMVFVESADVAQSNVSTSTFILPDQSVLNGSFPYTTRQTRPLSSLSSPTSSLVNLKERKTQVLPNFNSCNQVGQNKYKAFTDNIARHMESLDDESAFELECLLTRNMLDFVEAKRLSLAAVRDYFKEESNL